MKKFKDILFFISEMKAEDPPPENPQDPNAGSESIPDATPFGEFGDLGPMHPDSLDHILTVNGYPDILESNFFPWLSQHPNWGLPSFLYEAILEMAQNGASPLDILQHIHSWDIHYGPNGNIVYANYYIDLSRLGMPGMAWFFTFNNIHGGWSTQPEFLPIPYTRPDATGPGIYSFDPNAGRRHPNGFFNANLASNLSLETGSNIYYIDNSWYFVSPSGDVFTMSNEGLVHLTGEDLNVFTQYWTQGAPPDPVGTIGTPPYNGTNIDVPFGSGSVTTIRGNRFWTRPPGAPKPTTPSNNPLKPIRLRPPGPRPPGPSL